MGLLSFFGGILWKDVRELKEDRITRQHLNEAIAKSDAERDSRHMENTGNFRRLEEKLDQVEARHNESAVAIEKRIGEVLVEVAKIPRPSHRPDGPERRRGGY